MTQHEWRLAAKSAAGWVWKAKESVAVIVCQMEDGDQREVLKNIFAALCSAEEALDKALSI